MLEMKYFVLKPRSKHRHDVFALASREAMRAFADAIEQVDRELASSLRDWVIKECIALARNWPPDGPSEAELND